MELTFEAAFSAGGLVGHSSYLLLVISMLMRQLWLLRIFVVASAVAGILFDAIWLSNPVGVFWEGLLLGVNLVQLSIIYIENRRARFTAEEAAFVRSRFPRLGAAGQRRLLNHGLWISGGPGTVLTREGEPVSHLVYLASGEARIESGGKVVAVCEPGSFVGEMTVMGGESATGTAVLNCPSRYWCVEANVLRRLAAGNEEIARALELGFSIGLSQKLVRANRFIIETGTAEAADAADRSDPGGR